MSVPKFSRVNSKQPETKSRSSREKYNLSSDIYDSRRDSHQYMSSSRNETRRRHSYEKHYTDSNQVDKGKSNKEFRYSRQQSQPSSNFSRTDYAGARQQNDIRPRPPDESKWNDYAHSKSSHSRKTVLDYSNTLPQEGTRNRPHYRDLLYQGQDLKRSNFMQKRSHSGSFEWEGYGKKSKREYQDGPSSSEQKADQAVTPSWLQSFEQRKSESPPPSHRKPVQKLSKNSNKTDKHKNPLDEASLYALQKAQALLKAQLAADSTDEVMPLPYTAHEALPLPYTPSFGSSKIVYMLDSEEHTQYSIKSDHPAVTSLVDVKVTGEHSSGDPKSSASSLSTLLVKTSKSPNSDSLGSESWLKDHKTKGDRSMSHWKMRRDTEQAPGKDKIQTDVNAEACSSKSVTIASSSVDRVEEKDFGKLKFPDILQEPAPIIPKARSCSSSSSSSSSSIERQHRHSKQNSDKPTSGYHSRSGSESPSQLRASLLEQIRRKIEGEQKNDPQLSCHEQQKRSVYELKQLDEEQKNVEGLSPSSQNITNVEYSCLGKRTPKSSSSSPEPPPVIPRVHLSRFGVFPISRIQEDCGNKADTILKTSNEGHSLTPAAPSISSRQLLPEEPNPAVTLLNQNSGLSTQNKSKPITESSISPMQLLPEEPPPTGALPNQQADFSATHKSTIVMEVCIPSVSPVQLFPEKTQPNQQPDSSSNQKKSKSAIEDFPMSIKDIPVPSDPPKPLSGPYITSIVSPCQQSSHTPLSFQAISDSTTSQAQPALSSELPTSTSISAEVDHQPISFLTIMDHIQLSSVPLPGEPSTSSGDERTSIKKPTIAEELNTIRDQLFLGHKSQDNDNTTQKMKEQMIPKFNIRTVSSRSSFSSSMGREKAVVTMQTASIDKTDVQEMDFHTQKVKEADADINKEISQNITPLKHESSKPAETFKEGRFKRISNRNFPEKNLFHETEISRSNNASSSSSRDRRRSRNRSRSTDRRYQKKSNSPFRQRNFYSRRSGRSPPTGRTSSRSQRWLSPPRSSWKSHGVNRCDKSPPRRRSRSHERHRKAGKRRTKSRSKSRSNSRAKRLSSTSSSD